MNNYKKEVFNGDIGRIAADRRSRSSEVVVDFDGKPVAYDFGELDEIVSGVRVDDPQSPGSEYPAVVIPLHTQHFLMLQRNLLYTGLTRGKKLVVLVGSRKALEMAVRRQETGTRCGGCASGWRRGPMIKGSRITPKEQVQRNDCGGALSP